MNSFFFVLFFIVTQIEPENRNQHEKMSGSSTNFKVAVLSGTRQEITRCFKLMHLNWKN